MKWCVAYDLNYSCIVFGFKQQQECKSEEGTSPCFREGVQHARKKWAQSDLRFYLKFWVKKI